MSTVEGSYVPVRHELEDDSPEGLLDFLEGRGLGDGLPIIAPTSERVERMLAYASGDPDDILCTLLPRSGVLTRRVAAINAVMAGCPPQTFPVVLTALQALARPEVNLRGVNATTHPVAMLVLVHGEIAAAAGFSGGVGCFGPGNRANATVGRAVRLVMLNVAGAKPGFGDAATHGAAGEIHVLCGREPGRVALGRLCREPRGGCSERGHGVLRRRPAQRARCRGCR